MPEESGFCPVPACGREGRPKAIRLLEDARGSAAYGWEGTDILGYAYAAAPGTPRKQETGGRRSTRPDEKVVIFAVLGDKNRTFAALDRITVLGAPRIGRYLNYRELALLRGDPRLKALRKKVRAARLTAITVPRFPAGAAARLLSACRRSARVVP